MDGGRELLLNTALRQIMRMCADAGNHIGWNIRSVETYGDTSTVPAELTSAEIVIVPHGWEHTGPIVEWNGARGRWRSDHVSVSLTSSGIWVPESRGVQ